MIQCEIYTALSLTHQVFIIIQLLLKEEALFQQYLFARNK